MALLRRKRLGDDPNMDRPNLGVFIKILHMTGGGNPNYHAVRRSLINIGNLINRPQMATSRALDRCK